MVAPALYLLLLVLACCFASLTTPWLLVLLMAVGAVLVNGTWHGLGWSAAIANHIAGLYTRNVYDLLAVLPAGAIGAVWGSIVSTMHRDNRFDSRLRLRTGASIALVISIAVVVISPLFSGNAFNAQDARRFFVLLGLGIIAAYFDYAQSILLSGLAGVAGGILVRRPYDAGAVAAILFVALQSVAYTGAFSIGAVMLPALFQPDPAAELELLIAAVLLCGATVLVLRELAVYALWRWILRRVEADHF